MGCKVIQGKDFNAIICGGKGDHECNEEASVYLLEDGSRVEETPANFEKYKDRIRGGSVACSICGRAAFDDAAWL